MLLNIENQHDYFQKMLFISFLASSIFRNIIFFYSMIKSSVVFKDSRNERRTQAVSSLATSRTLKSKQISRTTSIKQINLKDLKGYDNKNQRIKNIDHRLELHQEEINKNSQIIEQLSQNFINLKKNFDNEKEKCRNEERKNQLLQAEIERILKLLNAKIFKVQQYTKKITGIQKENEALKIGTAKCEEYIKTIAFLNDKIITLQKNSTNLKGSIAQKQQQMAKCKEKVANFENIKKRDEENSVQMVQKDELIGSLRQAIDQLNINKIQQSKDKQKTQAEMQKLHEQIIALNKLNKLLKQKKKAQEKELNQFKIQIENVEQTYKGSLLIRQNRQKQQILLKIEINQLKTILDELRQQLTDKIKQIANKNSRIEILAKRIRQLQKNLGQSYKEIEKLRQFQDKARMTKQRIQQLQSLYLIIVPQIQCHFGHVLNNPVTVIPCGHNYCHGCTKGYQKQCTQCGGMQKIQAVYRNQLMDDIIQTVGKIKQIIELLN